MQVSPERFLAAQRVFSRAELLEGLEVGRRRTLAAAEAALGTWLRSGRVRAVKRGVFVRADLRLDRHDLWALGCRMARDAVLAYHSALEIHGSAASLYEDVVFVTQTKVKPLQIDGRRMVPVRPSRMLEGRAERWVVRIDRGPYELRVTSLERTVADALDRPDLAGGYDEAWRSCQAVPALDPDELVAYVETLGRRVLAAKVGHLLESRAEELLVPETTLRRLEGLRPERPVYAVRGAPGRLEGRWNLLVPRSLGRAGTEMPE